MTLKFARVCVWNKYQIISGLVVTSFQWSWLFQYKTPNLSSPLEHTGTVFVDELLIVGPQCVNVRHDR
jgi:hypothetical protein